MSSKHQTQRELQKRPRQQDDFQKNELQKKPRQQDDFKFEIQAAIERQQKADDQLKYHRKSQEEVLRGLITTTTTNDFQRFIRAERDKQHMYTQDQDLPAVNECMTEIKSLAKRQKLLGGLEQMKTDEYLECEQQIIASSWCRR